MPLLDQSKPWQSLINQQTNLWLAKEMELLEALTTMRNMLTSLVSEISRGVFDRSQLLYMQAVVGSIKAYAQKIYNSYRGQSGDAGRIANMANNVMAAADQVLNEIAQQLEKLPPPKEGPTDEGERIQEAIDKLISEGKPLPFDPRQLDY